MRQQIRQHVVAMLIVSRRRRTRALADDHFEWRIRRIAREIFVGINLKIRRVIDGNDLHLIQVHSFFERLHKAEAELAVFFANRIAINLDVFGGARNITLAGADPMSNDTRSEHVSN